MSGFPARQHGTHYMTEGGQETELMYKHGHELPEFAMFPLLDDPSAVADLTEMYERYLGAAAEHGFHALMGGLDYRASPDWADKLGISRDGLAEYQLRSIAFLRDVAEPFAGDLPGVLIAGIVGPRGDAYGQNRTISAEEAEDYHGVQIGTLREAVEAVDAQAGDARPDFYGINCSHPHEFASALEPGAWRDRLRSLRPNASAKEKVALCSIGHLESGDPEALGQQVAEVAARLGGIDVLGGCCGTWDEHLSAIGRRVRAVGGRPSG